MPIEAILEALIARERTGEGAELSISMFDAMADWMTVPLLAAGGRQAAAAHRPRPHLDLALRRVPQPRRRRHSHLDPERPRMARARGKSLGRRGARRRSGASPPMSSASNAARETDGKVAAMFGALDADAAEAKTCRRRYRLRAASTARPIWRTIRICAASPSARRAGRYPIRRRRNSGPRRVRRYGPVPALGAAYRYGAR